LRFIFRSWPLKIGAVLLAIILYVGMVFLQTTQEWPGTIAIEFVNQPATAVLMKPDLSLANSLPTVSNIRYVAAPDVPVTRDSFRATVDLANVKVSENEDTLVKVQLVAPDPRIQILDYQPQQLTVALDPVVHKQVSVQVDTGAVPSALQPGTPVLSASTVDASGAASIVRRVAYADAQIRIDASGLDVSQDVVLVAHDATGAVVDSGKVTFSPRTVHVAVQVGSKQLTETVPVNPITVNSPAAGYIISSIDVNPAVVAVKGQADALVLLKGLANTQPISIAGATADVSTTVGLDLPSGVTADEVPQITVTVHLQSPPSTRSVSVGLVPEGARSDRIYSLSTPSVTITIGGATAALNAFDTSTLVGMVSVGGLDVGAHSVIVTTALPPGIKLVGISPSQITVTVTNAPTPPPAPSASPT
ncbi:MAG TPA: CdaR family protein, partial [Candidatus Limnocylindrales bacterium]